MKITKVVLRQVCANHKILRKEKRGGEKEREGKGRKWEERKGMRGKKRKIWKKAKKEEKKGGMKQTRTKQESCGL